MGSNVYVGVVITDDNRARRKSTEPVMSTDDSIVVNMKCVLTYMFLRTAIVFVRKCTH